MKNIRNYMKDIGNEKTKISQKCYNYLNREVFYISSDWIDKETKTCYVYLGACWMFHNKPPKHVITWFEKYIKRVYGYTITDWI